MYEDRTYDNLIAEWLGNAPDGINTRQGEIYFDAGSGILLKIARLYTDLNAAYSLIRLDTSVGPWLDEFAREHGLSRRNATPARYRVTFEGATPELKERFYANALYFFLDDIAQDGSEELIRHLCAEVPGTEGNYIYSGIAAVPVNNIPGLTKATFGELLESGTDTESDESLRNRIREKIAGPAENGNKQHYKTWCEQDDGVGRARIVPLAYGENTVKGILINPNGQPCDDTVVARVQKHVDPDDDGDGHGDGLGEGVANLGAHFTAVSAFSTSIDIAFGIVLRQGYTAKDVHEQVTDAVTRYLKDLALNTPDTESVVVRWTNIGSMISGLEGVLDYDELTLNGGTANIEPGFESVAVLGEVDVYASAL